MGTGSVCTDQSVFLGWPGWGSRWSCCTVGHDPRWKLSSFELGNKVLAWQRLEKRKTTPEMVCLYQVLFYKTSIGAVETEQERATSMRGGLRCFGRVGALGKQTPHSLQKRRQRQLCNAWDAEEQRKAGHRGCEKGTKSWSKRRQVFHNASAHSLPIEGN